MTMEERYDQLAARYDRWWAPVLAPAARSAADHVAALVESRPGARILDIGTGTGTLAVELIRRFPNVSVTGADASAGMIEEAQRLASRTLASGETRRLTFVHGAADSLPFEDRSFDAAVSSFVFQLVPDRFAALREARRVLRPDGLLVVLTWLGDEQVFEPDEALEDAIDELGLTFDDEPGDGRIGNFESPAAAEAQVRRAGFRDVHATATDLVHHYDPATYLEFLEQYAERSLFEGLDRADRKRLRDSTARRLARLAPAEFAWRMRIVTVVGRRNGS